MTALKMTQLVCPVCHQFFNDWKRKRSVLLLMNRLKFGLLYSRCDWSSEPTEDKKKKVPNTTMLFLYMELLFLLSFSDVYVCFLDR